MRIEYVNEFNPVSIVLETQDEVNFMYELTRNIAGVGEIRNFFDAIGAELSKKSTLDYNHQSFRGDLTVTGTL